MTRLLRDARGVTAVEFALVAPAFLMFMFLTIDGARMAWTYQTLQEVAVNSARCAALGVTGCKTAGEVQSYAVARAAAGGVRLTAAAVTLTPAATCSSVAGMTKVAIASSYQGASTKLLPSKLTALSTESCFPTAS
ncbi:TadE family protein [Rhizorhabdus wittichii DC-6]|uniref:TadE/TadG family type IV pilus assembly protein n=1 Tax=Rhizorhabdus wittichii TaxID=160791 RepID=UPI0002E8390F|nr:TadE family protein [Rhizorhabdus wittichii]ARR54427.1 TadE family protein [Rhizorhabdus wittichii DC-6]